MELTYVNAEKTVIEQELDFCCDDIERFVARLQDAGKAFNELEKLKIDIYSGMQDANEVLEKLDTLRARAKPPNNNDFIDIFQKFKYAFNILARIQPYIHDPNAPELVHFLFTPLNLIYEASRESQNAKSTLSPRAVSPLLSSHTKDLLSNCLTSLEHELWLSLGDAWFMTEEEWNGPVQPYIPHFYNGWQAAPSESDEDSEGTVINQAEAKMASIQQLE